MAKKSNKSSDVTFYPSFQALAAATSTDAHDNTADDSTGDDNLDSNNHDDVEIRSAVDYPREHVEWLWPGKIPIGKVTLLVGDPGLGKSVVALDVASRVTRGAAWPDCQPPALPGVFEPIRDTSTISAANTNGATKANTATDPRQSRGLSGKHASESAHLPPSTLPLPPSPGSVIILSAEDGIADTIRPRLDAHGADPSRVFFLPTVSDLRHDLGKLEAALKRLPNVRLIVVDPVNAYVGASDSHFHTIVRKVLEPLAELADKRRIAILAVTNLRKNDGAAIYRAAGSMGFVAASRAVWTICRDKTDPCRNLLLPVKNNLAPLGAGLAYTIDSHPDFDAPLVRWQSQAVTTTVEEAFRPPLKSRGPEAEDRRLAGEWLKIALADGPRESWFVLHEGRQNGFHERTLQRALHAIGGQTKKDGYVSGWLWSLPQADAPSQAGETGRDQGEAGTTVESTVEKPVAFDETCRLREKAEKNGAAEHFDWEPPSPPSVVESIQFLNRLDAKRNGRPTARVSREPVADKDPNSPTGHPILDMFLAEFRKQTQSLPKDSESKSESKSETKLDNQHRTADHGPPTEKATKKVPGAIPVFVREPTPDTSLAQRTLADPERSIAAAFPPT